LSEIIKRDDWVQQLYGQIEKYLCEGEFGINKLRSLNKYVVKEGENETQDGKYHCKYLATIYNFFEVRREQGKITNIQIKKGQQDNLKKFLYDDEAYSIEHFIFNEKGKTVVDCLEGELTYNLPSSAKKFVSSLFNFIFINKKINNERLQSYCIKWKMEHLKIDEIDCSYSRLVYNCIQKSALLRDYPVTENLDSASAKAELDNYYETKVVGDYQELVNQILDGVKKCFH